MKNYWDYILKYELFYMLYTYAFSLMASVVFYEKIFIRNVFTKVEIRHIRVPGQSLYPAQNVTRDCFQKVEI